MNVDVIVIGAGHNGLVAAATLAREGRRVGVVEARSEIGGLAARETFETPRGLTFTTPGVLHETDRLRPQVVDELELGRFGLELMDPTPIVVPEENGSGLVLSSDDEATRSSIARRSVADADAYVRWRTSLAAIRRELARLLDEPALQLTSARLGDLWELLTTGLRLRRLGKKEVVELLRILPLSQLDGLSEWFEDPLLQSALGTPALTGTRCGPRATGTYGLLLLEAAHAHREVRGGPAALVDALRACGEARGVEIRTAATVRRILVSHGTARGVELVDGSVLSAPTVISTCDPRRTFHGLIDPRHLPANHDLAVRRWHDRGTTARMVLLLDGPLELRGVEGAPERVSAVRVCGSPLEGERAADAIKYGELSRSPTLEVRVPTVNDPQLAPDGHHVVTVLAHYAPYERTDGWTEPARAELGERIVARLESVTPGLRTRIVHHVLQTPPDLEERYGASGGHIHHGEHALDQILFQRPSPELSNHATTIRGLYLGGSGTHPGGGISGAPGRLAARRVLGR